MRILVNYIRQIFCKHNWYVEETFIEEQKGWYICKGQKVYMRCKKCAYHKKH